MTIENQYYKFYVDGGKQKLLNKTPGLQSLTISIYLKEDTLLENLLLQSVLDFNTVIVISLCDNRYRIIVDVNYETFEHEYTCFNKIKNFFLENTLESVCNCDNSKNIKNDCISCENTFSTNIFTLLNIGNTYMFSLNVEDKIEYNSMLLHNLLLQEDSFLLNNIDRIIHDKFIKGVYSLDTKTAILYLILYYYILYKQDTEEDINIHYINNLYSIDIFKKCIINLGYSFEKFEDILSTMLKGKYIVSETVLTSLNCSDYPPLSTDLIYDKQTFENGFTVKITTSPKYLTIVVPKILGNVVEILDNGGANLITDTENVICGNYILYKFNYIFPPNNYNFKLKFDLQ